MKGVCFFYLFTSKILISIVIKYWFVFYTTWKIINPILPGGGAKNAPQPNFLE